MEQNFSVVLIARNESKTLPHLMDSLKEFQQRGGEVILCDTGSTDGTVDIARSFGCKVTEVGKRFIITIDKKTAKKINDTFIIERESPVVKEGDQLFDYASARNYAATLSSNNMIATPDCDECYTKFDLDKINKTIKDGAEQLEYNFVFSHDQYGNEAVKFTHCKFYNKTKLKWVGIVHEVLAGNAKRIFLDESIIKLEHFQNVETNRSGYLRGLALDCYLNPKNDRNSHYIARELMWSGRPKSAIKEFKRHIIIGNWLAEKAQSIIFIGDCYGMINQPEKQVEYYNKGFYIDSSRREALIKLAYFYKHNNNPQAVACYASAALEIPWTAFYANDLAQYQHIPYELLYWAKGWLGNIESARENLNKAREFQPLNSNYLRDYRFYNKLPKVSFIIPQLGREEGLKRCVNSIHALNYPQDLIDIRIIPGNETVPQKIKKGVEETTGEYICYAANDMEFTPDALILNIIDSITTGKRLVVFDTVEVDKNGIGIRNEEGYTCEHFIIKRDLIPLLDDEIFDTDFKHYCVDDLLWKKCEKLNESMIGKGTFIHYHPSRIGSGIEIDWVNEKALSSLTADRKLLANKLSEIQYIPKRIITIWLNPSSVLPNLIAKCITSQNLVGWEHRVVTLENVFVGCKYLQDCLDSRNWAKAVDYLRIYYLYQEGGIYMDADVEVIRPLNDSLLKNHIFACREENGFISNAIIGAEKGNPLLKEYLDRVEKLDGSDHKVFEYGMEIWNEMVQNEKIYPAEYFIPYNHQTGETKITNNTYTIHHFTKSWKYPNIHLVCDLRPRINNPEKLKALNIGIGSMGSAIAQQLLYIPFKELTMVDVYEPYIDNAKKLIWQSPVNFMLEDARNVNYNNYDFVMMFDVLEHIPKEDSIKILKSMVQSILIFGPLENRLHSHRIGTDDIESQDHVSLWTEQDFKDLGFKTEVIKNFHQEEGEVFDAIWAYNF